jgi:hypothetical protein
MSRCIFITILFFLLLLTKNYCFADFNKALEAYNKQNWSEALNQCLGDINNHKCLNLLGVINMEGYGIKNNYSQANTYFLKAKQLGSKSAEFNLGWMALKGLGEEINLDKAAKIFEDYYLKNMNFNKNDFDKLNDSNEVNLLKLENNNLLSKYNYFYTNYIKLKALLIQEINIKNNYLTNITNIENKLKSFDKILINANTNIGLIKANITEEQEILIKLLILNVKNDENKFEKIINETYLILYNFQINKI